MVENPRLKNTRGRDFRYVYANGIAAQFGGIDGTLIFGIKEDQSVKDGPMLEEIAIVMAPQTVKVLAISLSKMIESIEKATGQIIPVDVAQFSDLERALAASNPPKDSISPTS